MLEHSQQISGEEKGLRPLISWELQVVPYECVRPKL